MTQNRKMKTYYIPLPGCPDATLTVPVPLTELEQDRIREYVSWIFAEVDPEKRPEVVLAKFLRGSAPSDPRATTD